MAHDTRHRLPWSRKHDEGHTEHEAHRERRAEHVDTDRRAMSRDPEAHDKYGGVNIGAAFFGWLVAVAMTVLLGSIVGTIASAVGAGMGFTQTEAEQEAAAVGLGAAIVVVLVTMLAYYTGGYVAGRMSRFDGGRQGVATWLIGLVVTVIAAVGGWLLGSEYNLLAQVSMPQVQISPDMAAWGGAITALAVLIGTLVAAMAGGKVGHRYHDKVDRAAWH